MKPKNFHCFCCCGTSVVEATSAVLLYLKCCRDLGRKQPEPKKGITVFKEYEYYSRKIALICLSCNNSYFELLRSDYGQHDLLPSQILDTNHRCRSAAERLARAEASNARRSETERLAVGGSAFRDAAVQMPNRVTHMAMIDAANRTYPELFAIHAPIESPFRELDLEQDRLNDELRSATAAAIRNTEGEW